MTLPVGRATSLSTHFRRQVPETLAAESSQTKYRRAERRDVDDVGAILKKRRRGFSAGGHGGAAYLQGSDWANLLQWTGFHLKWSEGLVGSILGHPPPPPLADLQCDARDLIGGNGEGTGPPWALFSTFSTICSLACLGWQHVEREECEARTEPRVHLGVIPPMSEPFSVSPVWHAVNLLLLFHWSAFSTDGHCSL